MKRTSKYAALEVHQATTVASVCDQSGRVIARGILPTDGPALVEFLRGKRGSVHVAFEEGSQAPVAARSPGSRTRLSRGRHGECVLLFLDQ